MADYFQLAAVVVVLFNYEKQNHHIQSQKCQRQAPNSQLDFTGWRIHSWKIRVRFCRWKSGKRPLANH